MDTSATCLDRSKKPRKLIHLCAYLIKHDAMTMYGEVEVYLQHSSPRHWLELRAELHSPANLLLGKELAHAR
jgi:hypothetical protein